MAVLTLADLSAQTIPIMADSEDDLAVMLGSISSGETVSNADLLKFQLALATNSLTANITSSIIKERSDTLKGVAQKF